MLLLRFSRAVVLCALCTGLVACAGESERNAPGMRSVESDSARNAMAAAGAGAAGDSLRMQALRIDDFENSTPTDAQFATRVVSLNPAFTEIVFAIGAGAQLVGRTSWDNRPAEALDVTNVGAGIRPNVEAVLATRPTLVLLYATAENRAAADALARAGVRTIALRTVTIADFKRAAHVIGQAVGQRDAAAALVDSISTTLESVRLAVANAPRPRVVWPSWESPVLVVGDASYEAELLEIAGAENVFADRKESVAGVTIEEIARRDPELVLAGPERISRMRESAPWRAVRAVREGNVLALDSNVVGRPGVTIGMAAVSIARLLHPDRADRLPLSRKDGAVPATPGAVPATSDGAPATPASVVTTPESSSSMIPPLEDLHR